MKPRKFLVGGIVEISGKWHGFFDTHYPCDGTQKHINCTIVERRLSDAFNTQGEAISSVYEMKDKSGIKGWEIVGPKA